MHVMDDACLLFKPKLGTAQPQLVIFLVVKPRKDIIIRNVVVQNTSFKEIMTIPKWIGLV